ncbi:MAG: group 1 truncated hemoglobin [Nitrospirae bacterium]|nr:group 1 truncated hemoglobin [Candidatus Troglogloeales bacterium]
MGMMHESSMGMMHESSLYERLGGKPAIDAVVEDFVNRLGGDTRIKNEKVKARLAAISIPNLKMHLANLICAGTGGPCKYGGRDMKNAHVGLSITSHEFDLTVEDLVTTLDKFKVPA